jgi:hypothetical protein
MNTPFWFLLLRSWRQRKAGLSVPFIVGADASCRESAPMASDARRLVSEIFGQPLPDYLISIHVCPDLKIPVIGIHGIPANKLQIDLDDSWGRSTEDKLESVIEQAEAMIASGRLSRVGTYPNQKWGDFTASDIEFIDSVIKKHRGV